MGKVQFQVDGLDSNTTSIFNDDVTFDGNVDANSISISGTDLFNLLPSGTTYANTEPSNPIIGQVWIDADSSVTSLTQNDLLPYAPIASPSFTGNVTLPTNTSIGNISATEISYLDGVTSSIQSQLNTKSPVISPTFTGTVSLPSTTSVGNVSATELGYLDGVTSAIQTQLNTKAPTSNPTFSGTVIADAISTSGSGISGSLFTNITTGTAIIGTGLTSGGVSIAPGSSFNGTVAIATGSISSGTRTVNIGTGQATGATTNINLGSSNGTSVVSINSGLETRKTIRTGTNSYGKNINNGDIALDNGTTDTPGILFYTANNTNFGFDVADNTLRFVKNLNEAGGSVVGSFDTSGNLTVQGNVNGSTLGDTGWIQITSFGSGWSAVGQSVFSRKINNVVYLRGNVYNASGGGTGAFTLPEGHRPATEMVFAVQQYGAGSLTYATVGTNGVVVPQANGAWLAGIVFPIG